MSEAYIFDKNTSENGDKRTHHELNNIISSVTPSNIRIKDIVPAGRGFIIKYDNEKDANYLLESNTISTLDSHNLVPNLTKAVAKEREIFLINAPDFIHEKPADEILTEIRKFTDTIIHVKLIIIPSSNRKYIILTAETHTARNDILTNQSLKLFGQNIKAEAPKNKNDTRNSQHSHFRPQNPQGHHDPSRPRPIQHHAGYRTFPRPQTTAPPPRPSNEGSGLYHWPYLTPPHVQFPLDKSRQVLNTRSDTDILFIIKATVNMIEQLHEGKELPFEFVNGVNKTFLNHGLASIDIPYDQILLSRNIYERKSSLAHACKYNIPPPIAKPHASSTFTPSSHPSPIMAPASAPATPNAIPTQPIPSNPPYPTPNPATSLIPNIPTTSYPP